ncbi:MAG: hypothetical protein ACH36H_07825 [Candidatus Nanopelagicales bacterium]
MSSHCHEVASGGAAVGKQMTELLKGTLEGIVQRLEELHDGVA